MSSAPFPIYQLMENWAAHAYGTPEVRAHHHALYYALLNLVKTKGGLTRFSLAYGHGMECSGIGSKATYLAALRELQGWGFLTYTPGENRFILPIIEVTIQPSTGPLLALYRTSIATSTDTSTGRNKEVVRLKVEYDEKAAAVKKLEEENEKLKAELLKAQTPATTQTAVLPAKAAALATTDGADEQHWSVGPLTKSHAWKAICERQGFAGIDFEHYRKQALVAAEDGNVSRTIAQWNSWVRNFLNNQLKNGPLLKPTDGEAARTGVHAPQFEGGYQHQVRAEVQAERHRERQQNINLRIAANLAKHAAEGQQHQANPIGGAGRPPGA